MRPKNEVIEEYKATEGGYRGDTLVILNTLLDIRDELVKLNKEKEV